MAINGMPDHVHILIVFTDIALSVLVRDIKSSTTNYINEQNLLLVNSHGKADSELLPNSKSQVMKVVSYIQRQEEHHKKKSFRESI